MTAPPDDGSTRRRRRQQWVWVWFIPLVMTTGVLAVVAYSAALHSWSVFAYGTAASCAAIVAGGLIGFIFGIPRSASNSYPQTGEQYQDNSNLEQISDWLTKILVGVGLVQLGHATNGLAHLASAMEPGFGNKASSAGFGLAIVLFYTGTGFLYLYLWTRTGFLLQLRSLVRTVRRVATEAAETKATEIAKATSQEKLGEIQAQLQNMFSVVDRALYPNSGVDTPSQDELNATMAQASSYARQQAFLRAEEHRRANWRDNKSAMELVIPVFRALIASDRERVYHRNHGELGFALKDKADPDWRIAFRELTAAIEIRGNPASEKGWAVYEAIRALCRINLDSKYRSGQLSSLESTAEIVADLTVADLDSYAHKLLGKPDIKRWLVINRGSPNVNPLWEQVREVP